MKEICSTDPKDLYKKLELAKRQLKNARNKEEVVAITRYIEQLYSSIGYVSLKDLTRLKIDAFSNKKQVKVNNKRFISLKCELLDNFVEHQDFHKDFFNFVFKNTDRELKNLKVDDYSPITILNEDDYYSIFFEFMSSIGLSKLFDKFIKNGRIYSGADDDIYTLGFTINNPLTNECDIFLDDFRYDICSLYTLAHEFGHVYDLGRLDGGAKAQNVYRVQSFYQEVISKTFERLFIDFLISKNILKEEALDLSFDMSNHNYLYIVSAFIVSLMPEKYIDNENYMDLSRTRIYNLVKDSFPRKSNVKKIINTMGELEETQEVYSYAYGDIMSMFFSNMIEDNDGKLDVLDEFMPHRAELFNPDTLEKLDISAKEYVKLYKKDLEMLKSKDN